jgi:outer membrane protein TolC
MIRLVAIAFLSWLVLVPVPGSAEERHEIKRVSALPTVPLTLDEVLAWIDRTHPLLKGSGTEKIVARGKLLRALGIFEPVLVNDLELERFIPSSEALRGNRDDRLGGFNDTFLEMRHPSGIRAMAGYRQGINPILNPDLVFNNGRDQGLFGGTIPLLRGLMVNPDNAELQRSQLADPRAEVQIAQTRQDLFLAAATQYWDWVAAVKLRDVQERALKVAEDRYKQIEQRAKAGAAAPLDAVEADQEVKRRKEIAIAAARQVEQEQYRLSMFLWVGGSPTTPDAERAPDFPRPGMSLSREVVTSDKLLARSRRPEVREVEIDAKLNNIDLELAKNNLLPSLDLSAEPPRTPQSYVLGLGYRFGLEFRLPFLQRRARGEALEAQGKADRFVLVQKFREQQVIVDVDNALSAVERTQQRIAAAFQSLQLAKTLEEGERFRFSLGATSVLFVNLRERNAVDSENQYFRAQADYQKAVAFYRWATGEWAQSPGSVVPVSYRPKE